jgi:curved DNA-binding protein CbpA
MAPRPVVPDDDLYARLEVPRDATFEAIEIAWRALLKRHHPDVAGGDGLELAKRINVAHDWLRDTQLRSRYDAERYHGDQVRRDRADWAATTPRAAPQSVRRAPRTAAEALRRFLDRVGRLSRDELDRLSVAETTSIAFVASIRRFLAADSLAAAESVEGEVRRRLAPADWANPAIRDAIVAAGLEIVLAGFLDEHLSEPFRSRARDRLMRGWEAAVDQPRYGPNTAVVRRFLERVTRLTEEEARALAGAIRGRIGADPWPRGLDPDEDDGLRVSSALAGRDAVALATVLASVDRASATRDARLLRRTAHALVLRHAFSAADFGALVYAWQVATRDPGTGRHERGAAGATVRRRQG